MNLKTKQLTKNSQTPWNLFHDDTETESLVLQSSIKGIIVLGRCGKNAIHERHPLFQKAFVIRMPRILPVREQACLAGRVLPEPAPVFEPGFILIEKTSHGWRVGSVWQLSTSFCME
jgi:hypothetical protein